jgi:uncharacterized protein
MGGTQAGLPFGLGMMSRSSATKAALQWLVSRDGSVNLQVVVKPGSAQRRILRRDIRGLVIALNSQPSKGRANEELIRFLAELLGAQRSSVTITRGLTERVKTVQIVNPEPARVTALLSAYP